MKYLSIALMISLIFGCEPQRCDYGNWTIKAETNKGQVQINDLPPQTIIIERLLVDSWHTIRAIPNEGYTFERWSTGATANPLSISIEDCPDGTERFSEIEAYFVVE